jgi:hypothetical protein
MIEDFGFDVKPVPRSRVSASGDEQLESENAQAYHYWRFPTPTPLSPIPTTPEGERQLENHMQEPNTIDIT